MLNFQILIFALLILIKIFIFGLTNIIESNEATSIKEYNENNESKSEILNDNLEKNVLNNYAYYDLSNPQQKLNTHNINNVTLLDDINIFLQSQTWNKKTLDMANKFNINYNEVDYKINKTLKQTLSKKTKRKSIMAKCNEKNFIEVIDILKNNTLKLHLDSKQSISNFLLKKPEKNDYNEQSERIFDIKHDNIPIFTKCKGKQNFTINKHALIVGSKPDISFLNTEKFLSLKLERIYKLLSFNKTKSKIHITKSNYYETKNFFTYKESDVILYLINQKQIDKLVKKGLSKGCNFLMPNFNGINFILHETFSKNEKFEPSPLYTKTLKLFFKLIDKNKTIHLDKLGKKVQNKDKRNICKLKRKLGVTVKNNKEFISIFSDLTKTSISMFYDIWRLEDKSINVALQKANVAIDKIFKVLNMQKSILFNLTPFLPNDFVFNNYIRNYTLDRMASGKEGDEFILVNKTLARFVDVGAKNQITEENILKFLIKPDNITNNVITNVANELFQTIIDTRMQDYYDANSYYLEFRPFLIVINDNKNIPEKFNTTIKDEIFEQSNLNEFDSAFTIVKDRYVFFYLQKKRT